MPQKWATITVYVMALLLAPYLLRAEEPKGDQVAGRIVSALDGHPLAHATITLTNVPSEKVLATTSSDDEGHFHFDGVPAGKYRMTGNATNYFSAAYLAHGQYSTAIVTGAGLATESLELQLSPISSIAGHVLDNGEPVEHANMTLYREDPNSIGHITRFRVVQTDDTGTYGFSRVPPGRYFIVASGTPWYAIHPPFEPEDSQPPFLLAIDPALDVAYPPVFYPDALDPSGASPITLRSGEQMTADMQMHPQQAMTLTVRFAPDGKNDNRSVPQLTRSIFGEDEPVFYQNVSSAGNGAIRISGIAPGEYSLQDMGANGLVAHSSSVNLTGSSAWLDEAAPSETASVTVSVHMVNGALLPERAQLNLRGVPSTGAASGTLNEKGVAEFPNVPTGDYRFAFIESGKPVNILACTVNGKPVEDKRLHIASAGHVVVELTLSLGSFEIDGFVKRDGKSVAGSLVALVPAGSDTNAELFRRDQSDLDGSFSFYNVAPGNYIVIAVENGSDLRWTDVPTVTPYLLHGLPVSISTMGPTSIRLTDSVDAQQR